jgi:hypothetical protein
VRLRTDLGVGAPERCHRWRPPAPRRRDPPRQRAHPSERHRRESGAPRAAPLGVAAVAPLSTRASRTYARRRPEDTALHGARCGRPPELAGGAGRAGSGRRPRRAALRPPRARRPPEVRASGARLRPLPMRGLRLGTPRRAGMPRPRLLPELHGQAHGPRRRPSRRPRAASGARAGAQPPQRTGVAFSLDAEPFMAFARSLPGEIRGSSGRPLEIGDIVDFDRCWATTSRTRGAIATS